MADPVTDLLAYRNKQPDRNRFPLTSVQNSSGTTTAAMVDFFTYGRNETRLAISDPGTSVVVDTTTGQLIVAGEGYSRTLPMPRDANGRVSGALSVTLDNPRNVIVEGDASVIESVRVNNEVRKPRNPNRQRTEPAGVVSVDVPPENLGEFSPVVPSGPGVSRGGQSATRSG